MAEPEDYDYDKFQQFYCLSAVANAVGNAIGTEANLQKALEDTLARLIPTLPGNWTVTWGPKVYKDAKSRDRGDNGPENVWYAAKSDVNKTVVVAVAGTAAANLKAWGTIDFDVTHTVDFKQWTSQWAGLAGQPINPPQKINTQFPGPFAAYGTCYGVANLLNNASPTQFAKGKLIYQYLKDDLPAGYTVVFTGHSMGGAVAPTLALGLLQSGLGGLKKGSVTVYPSASASPGNDAFTQSFQSFFPLGDEEGFRKQNAVFYNTWDVVPQAWGITSPKDRNLGRILGEIYKTPGDKLFLGKLIDWLIGKAQQSNMVYIPLPGVPFSAPFTPPGLNLLEYILTQHVKAYWVEIKILDFVEKIRKQLLAEPGVEEPDYVAMEMATMDPPAEDLPAEVTLDQDAD